MSYRGIIYTITYYPKDGQYRARVFAPKGVINVEAQPTWDKCQTMTHKAIDAYKTKYPVK